MQRHIGVCTLSSKTIIKINREKRKATQIQNRKKNLKHPPSPNDETTMDIDAEPDSLPLPEAQSGNKEKC